MDALGESDGLGFVLGGQDWVRNGSGMSEEVWAPHRVRGIGGRRCVGGDWDGGGGAGWCGGAIQVLGRVFFWGGLRDDFQCFAGDCGAEAFRFFQVCSVGFGVGEFVVRVGRGLGVGVGVDEGARAGGGVRAVELLEQHAELALGLGQAARVALLDPVELVGRELRVGAEGEDGVGDRIEPVEPLESIVEASDLLEQQVVVNVLGEGDPVLLERAEVGVDGGDGDVELPGDLLEGESFLSELVGAEDAPASSG